MRPSGAHTHPDSGGGLGLVVAVIIAAAAAGPVLAAVAAVAEALVITIAVLGGLTLAGGTALAVYRVRHRRAITRADVSLPRPVPWQHTEPLSAARAPAIEAARPEVHLHFHGVTAEDIAAILQRHTGQ
jgi:hypothetical protein